MTVALGQTAAGVDSDDTNSAGVAFHCRFQCLATTSVVTMWLKMGVAAVPSAANTHWAIYADAAGPLPGARLTADNTGTAAVSGAWSPFTIAPLAVTSGTFYWMAWLANVTNITYKDFATTGGTTKDSITSTLPNPFGSASGTGTAINCMYAEDAGGGVVLGYRPSRMPLGV